MKSTENHSGQNEDKSPGWGWRSSKRDPGKFPWRIATLVLLFVASALIYALNTSGARSQSEIDNQYRSIMDLRDEVKDLEIENSRLKDELTVLSDPDVVKVPLWPVEAADYHALVYRNISNEEVYLDPTQLPSPDPQMQYQLWIVTDATSVDLGTVLTGDIGFQKMKSSGLTGQIVLTLEPAGGSTLPNQSNIVVKERED